jgi:hypothetical protein
VLTARKWIAFSCLLAVLLAAVALPAASGLFLAILVPLWFFCALAASPLIRLATDSPAAPRAPFLAPVASRAPPAL